MGRTGLEGVTCGRSRGSERLLLTRSRTHTPHTLTRVHAPSEPLQTRGGGEPGLSRPDPGKAGAACVRTGAPPQGRAERVPPRPPSPPRAALAGSRGRCRPVLARSPRHPEFPGSSRRVVAGVGGAGAGCSGPGPAQARPGPILFPFPLRNALTRRLLKKSCRKSILSRDCPQTRLDFY